MTEEVKKAEIAFIFDNIGNRGVKALFRLREQLKQGR